VEVWAEGVVWLHIARTIWVWGFLCVGVIMDALFIVFWLSGIFPHGVLFVLI